ncbi:hypothetical protein [Bacillus timonensis]|nr:hypothetical protein [Bacillus timonensis]
MNYLWYQTNPMPFPYQQDYGYTEIMREYKHGHGGDHHGHHGKPGNGGGHGKPGHGGGHGTPVYGSHGGFQGGLPLLGGLAGGLLAGALLNSPNAYPFSPYPNYGYYPAYPPTPYPPYQNYPGYQYPPYGGIY